MILKRYPGVSPFTEKQQPIFFGRKDDIKKLAKLITLRNQVLLYSKSGIGKTSLLNAGVIPLLQSKFVAVHIRFSAYNEQSFLAPIHRILEALKINFPDVVSGEFAALDSLFVGSGIEKTLWYYLKKIQLTKATDRKILLVFDQFEELFSYPDPLVNQFKEQLFELTRIDIPNAVMKQIALQNDDATAQQEIMDLLGDEEKVKTIFAIRNDRLSLLNKLSDKLPDIQETYYELQPLNEAQLREAITEPARQQSADFASPAFTYLPEAIEKIIDELSNHRRQTVETTQLQIVCQQIEEIAMRKQQQTLAPALTIELADLPRFDAIFYNFYQSSVQKLETHLHEKARLLIEDQLIRNNQRISLDELICTDYLDRHALQNLVSTHLLRTERNSTEGFSYELSHDTLVAPILEARKNRIEKEEEENQLRVRSEELRVAKEKQRKQRQTITFVVLLALVFLGIGIFGIVMWRRANSALEQVKTEQLKTEKALNDFVEAEKARKAKEIEQMLNDVKSYIMFGKKQDARDYLNKILSIDSTNTEARKMLKEL